jgi:hypothetical protein
MEAAGIGYVAGRLGRRSVIVKAVSDFADSDKDDSFRGFACRASAELLLALLLRQLPVRSRRSPGSRRERDEERPMAPRDDFLSRVEAVCRMRRDEGDEIASIKRFPAPPPFGDYLRVEIRKRGRFPRVVPVAAVEQAVTEEVLQTFCQAVEGPYREGDPQLVSTLVYRSERPDPAVLAAAERGRVDLVSFAEYQRILDFEDYLRDQDRRLHSDAEYLPELYVDQRARIQWGLNNEELVDDAAQSVVRLLEEPRGRFVLVLAEFGTGKTFLLRQVAHRLMAGERRMIPVLVEMRALEKAHTLDALLGNHLPQAGMRRWDLDAFRYMLREGRVALLFDGYDELALRVTYDRAVEHLDTLIAAGEGDATSPASACPTTPRCYPPHRPRAPDPSRCSPRSPAPCTQRHGWAATGRTPSFGAEGSPLEPPVEGCLSRRSGPHPPSQR